MSGRNAKHRGFLLTELIVSMSVLGILLAGLAFSLTGFAKFNRYQLVRQQCIAAAQAQLDSITATGRTIPDEDFSRLWPGLTVAVKQTPGAGQWLGMQRVEVTVSGKSARTEVSIRLSRYILSPAPIGLAGEALSDRSDRSDRSDCASQPIGAGPAEGK